MLKQLTYNGKRVVDVALQGMFKQVRTGFVVERVPVPPYVPVQEVLLSDDVISILQNETYQLTATVVPSDATNKYVSWSTDLPSVATVSNKGLVTGTGGGTATITATAESKSATCIVNVEAVIAVESVQLNKSTLEMMSGDTYQLIATVLPPDASYDSIVWTTNNKEVATVEDGLVTAIADGTASITASAGGKSATCVVTVSTIIPVESISLNTGDFNLYIDETKQLSATVVPPNATYPTVTWSITPESVATITQNGLVTGVSTGVATITATADNKSTSCTVTVEEYIPVFEPGDLLASSKIKLMANATQGISYYNTPQVLENSATSPLNKFEASFKINSSIINSVGTTKIITIPGLIDAYAQNSKLFVSFPFYESGKYFYIKPELVVDGWNSFSVTGDSTRITFTINATSIVLLDSSLTKTYDMYTGKSGAYIVLDEVAPLSTADSWEIQTTIKWNGGSSYPAVFSYSGGRDWKTPSLIYEGGNMKFYLSSTGNSWNLNTSGSSFIPKNGDTYDIKAGFTGDTYYLDYKLAENADYINALSKTSTEKVHCSVPFWLMGASLNGNYWNYGTLNMTNTKIIVNGEPWFDGALGTGFTNNNMTYTQETVGPIYPTITLGSLLVYLDEYSIKDISIKNIE